MRNKVTYFKNLVLIEEVHRVDRRPKQIKT